MPQCKVWVFGRLTGEFDLVLQKRTVEEWIAEHRDVFYFRRKVKFTNPGREIDEDRAEMQALAARSKEEIFKASYGRTLRLQDSETFSRKLDGVETGDLEVVLRARGPGGSEFSFTSDEQPEHTFVPDFGDNLDEVSTGYSVPSGSTRSDGLRVDRTEGLRRR